MFNSNSDNASNDQLYEGTKNISQIIIKVQHPFNMHAKKKKKKAAVSENTAQY